MKKVTVAGLIVLFLLGMTAIQSPADEQSSVIAGMKKAVLLYLDCDSLENPQEGINIHVDPVLQPGKFGNAFRIEPPTSNLIANPTFDGIGGWTAIGTPKELKDGGFFTGACLQIDSENYVRQTVTGLAPENAYCFSAYAKGTDGSLKVTIQSGDKKEEVSNFQTGNEFKRVSVGIIAGSSDMTITIKPEKGALIIDGAQLERGKTFPSSFYPKKEARSAEYVDVVPSNSILNPMAGSVACWAKLDGLGAAYGCSDVWAWCDNPEKGWQERPNSMKLYTWIRKGVQGWQNSFIVLFTDSALKTSMYLGSNIDDMTPGIWHHFVVTWKVNPGAASESYLYIDGQLAGSKTDLQLAEMKMPHYMYIGAHDGAYLDGLLDEFYTFNRPLDASEVKALYELKKPLGK